jgi:hypothetical protein
MNISPSRAGRLPAVLLAVAIAGAAAWTSVVAVGADQKTFSTAEAAAKALIDAVRSHNKDEVLAILGPGAKDIVSSGDEVQDKGGGAAIHRESAADHAGVGRCRRHYRAQGGVREQDRAQDGHAEALDPEHAAADSETARRRARKIIGHAPAERLKQTHHHRHRLPRFTVTSTPRMTYLGY